MKIRPVGAELFHADRQPDMSKLIIAFRNFANAPTMHFLPSTNFKLLNRIYVYTIRNYEILKFIISLMGDQ